MTEWRRRKRFEKRTRTHKHAHAQTLQMYWNKMGENGRPVWDAA